MNGGERAAEWPQWARATAPWREALRVAWVVARGDRYASIGLLVYAVFVVIALAAPLVAPYNPHALIYQPDGEVAANLPPTAAHWLGTTNLGREIFSQLLFGARAPLVGRFAAAFGVVVVGTFVGLLMRVSDVAFGIPLLPMAVVLVAFLGPNIWNTVLLITVLLWRDTGRV